MMKAKDMMLDFVETVFAITVSAFFFVYFILGDRISWAAEVLKSIMPLLPFLVIFYIKLRLSNRKYKKLLKSNKNDDIIIYFTKADEQKDLIVISLLPVVILLIALSAGRIYLGDMFQALTIYIIMVPWHFIIFRKHEEYARLAYISRGGLVKDQLMIYFLSFLLLFVPYFFESPGLIDLGQSAAVFGILFFWRKKLFKNTYI